MFGPRRLSLVTLLGDIGVALYLRACQALDPRLPSLNYLKGSP